jgi:hypothetical protein
MGACDPRCDLVAVQADQEVVLMNTTLAVLLGIAAVVAAVGWAILCTGWADYWRKK